MDQIKNGSNRSGIIKCAPMSNSWWNTPEGCKFTIDGYFKFKSGEEYWFDEDGMYHRTDGPASVRRDGTKMWYVHGIQHRLDGPAVLFSDQEMDLNEWWFEGKRISRFCIQSLIPDRLPGPITLEEFLRYLSLKNIQEVLET